MPSGKRARQQRQQAAARTPPPVRSKGVAGPRQASPRALAIAGAVVGVVVIAIVLGIVLSRGGHKDNTGFPSTGSCTSPVALAGACDANALFKGIPQSGLVLGKPSAPVEMELFIDVQCPICKNYEISYLPTIVEKYVRKGKVQIHLKPWAFIGPDSTSGRLGVIAASFQNKAYEYTKVLYDNQGTENTGWLTSTEAETIASSVNGLNIQHWLTDQGGSQAQSIASGVDALAKTENVQGTPTVLVGCKGGKLHDIIQAGYAPNLQQTEQALNAAACAK